MATPPDIPGTIVACPSCSKETRVPQPPASHTGMMIAVLVLLLVGAGGIVWYAWRRMAPMLVPPVAAASAKTVAAAPTEVAVSDPLPIAAETVPAPKVADAVVETQSSKVAVVELPAGEPAPLVREGGADIRLGDSREVVVRTLGQPPRTIRGGGREVMLYDEYEFDLANEVVTAKRERPQRKRRSR